MYDRANRSRFRVQLIAHAFNATNERRSGKGGNANGRRLVDPYQWQTAFWNLGNDIHHTHVRDCEDWITRVNGLA